MKKISRWGKRNPWKTRLIIVLVQLVLAAYAALLGIWLYAQGWALPGYLLSIGILLFLPACFFYPDKRSRFQFFRHTYFRQKALDMFLIAVSLVMVMSVSNYYTNAAMTENQPYRAELTVNKTHSKQLKSERKDLRQQLKQHRQTLKAEVKAIVGQMKTQKVTGEQVLLIILTILLALLLLYGVAALSCSIACSGADGLAVLVFLLGLGLIVWLSIVLIKKISRKGKEAGYSTSS
jgi:uncharacterized membrane protein YwzB